MKCLRKPPAARAKCLRALPAHRPTRDVESTLGEEGMAARWVLQRPDVSWFNDRGPYGGGSMNASTWAAAVDADDRPFGDRKRALDLLTQVNAGFGGDLLKALTQYPLVATDTGHLLDGWHRLYLWVKSGLPGGPPTLVMVPGKGGLGAIGGPNAPPGTFKQCSCGRAYTKSEWERLPIIGHQVTDDEEGRYDLELRNCPSCDSTIGVERKTHDGQGRALGGGFLTPEREAAFARFQNAVRHVWNKPEFVLPAIALSSEEPGNNRNPGGPPVLASITFNPQGVWAVGNRLLRRAPSYVVRLADRLLVLPAEDQWKILVHEAVHLGHPRHSREFRDLCREKGGTVSEEALDGQGIKAEKKVGNRYQTMRTFQDEREAKRWAQEQQRAEPGSRWRLSLGGTETPGTHEVWYHITDNPRFNLNPAYAPEDNSIAIYSRAGQQGIYLTQDVEKWVNGHNYVRPYVAEFHVDPSVKSQPGAHGRYGGELFIPATLFGKLRLTRVIPIDAYVREEFGEHGWIEAHHETEFDTGKPVARHGRFPNYHYTGPDVRQMSQKQTDAHAARWRAYMKGARGIDLDGLDLTTSTKEGPVFETGRPVTFTALHNNEKAPDFGNRFGQDIEPAGRYYIENENPGDLPRGWEKTTLTFKNPLVLRLSLDQDVYGPQGWKARLVAEYHKKGKALACHLRKLGHDGIVTVDADGYTREIVDLTGVRC